MLPFGSKQHKEGDEMERITVHDAARLMGVSDATLREGIALGVYPFGCCWKVKEGNSRRKVQIYPKAFADWMLANYGKEVFENENNKSEEALSH